ncbi:MAG: M20 family metallopeptidase [Haloarculaceae archaeon]
MTFDPLAFHERAVRTESHESVAQMRALLVDAVEEHAPEADCSVDDAGNVRATRTPEDTAGAGDASAASADAPHVVLNTHIDTVPPHVPYGEREGGDVVEGRGSCDAKGPLAALLDAFFAADVSGGRLTLAVTPDEETLSTGAAALAFGPDEPGGNSDPLDADAYIVGEPTGLDVCTAAKGRFEGTVTVTGSAAHAAEPQSGQNAIRAASVVVQAMETFDEERGPGEHESLGRPTLTPTRIAGGEASNQVPAECAITFDRRSVPPESAEGFRAALEEHCYQWLPTGMDCRVALTDRDTPFLEAFATDPDEPVVKHLRRASGGEVRPFSAATEASYFASDAPTVVFGPGVLADDEGAVAHSDREYVRREDVLDAATAVRETLDALLGDDG